MPKQEKHTSSPTNQLSRRIRAQAARPLLYEVRRGLADECEGRVQQELADLGLLDIMNDFLSDNE